MQMGKMTQGNSSVVKKGIRIMLVDDHPIFRLGVRRIIDAEKDMVVVAEAAGGNEALQMLGSKAINFVILDISLRDMDGLKLASVINSKDRRMPILILSMHDEGMYARRAIKSGARGYVMKDESCGNLVSAVRTVAGGGIHLSDSVKNNVIYELARRDEPEDGERSIIDTLSDRERQIFLMIGQGFTVKAIAEKLCLSRKTVETHRFRMKLKLNVNSIPRLILMAGEWAEQQNMIPSMI